MPQANFELTAEKGMSSKEIRSWITDFMKAAPPAFRQQNAELAAGYDAFVGKWPHWDKAQQAFAGRDYEAAIKSLKLVTRLDRNDYAARMNMAMAMASLGRFDEAKTALVEIADTFAGDADFHVTLGNVELSLGNREGALEQWVLALEAAPDCRPAMEGLVQIGVLSAVYEDPRDASSLTYVRTDSLVSHLQGVWGSEVREPRYFLEQIAYHEGEGRHVLVRAAADLGLAVATDASRILLLGARVRSLRGLGLNQEALAQAKEFTGEYADSVVSHVELAQCLSALGDNEGARVELEEALRLDPGDQQALALRFWPADRSDLQLIQDSIPSLQSHAAQNPEVAGAWRSLGRARIAVGSVEAGLDDLQRAVGLNSDDDDLRAEYWAELAKAGRFSVVLEDAARLEDLAKRDWKLRWNEAESLLGAGKKMEARAAFTAINRDESLLLDIRRRAKRAAERS